MATFQKFTVPCPACGTLVLFQAEIGWSPASEKKGELIPFSRLQQQAGGPARGIRRKKKLVCLNVLCGRRFSILVPQPGDPRTTSDT